MTDPFRVGQAVGSGVSVVCATCKKFWEGRDRKMDRCTAKAGCSGPIAGGDFHEYEGPITDFTRWCFVCGDSAKHGVRALGRRRALGICAKHIALLDGLRPVGSKPVPNAIDVTVNGNFVPLASLWRPKKSLMSAIMEVEMEHARKVLKENE